MKRSRLGMSVKNLERGGGTMRKILLVTLVAGLLMSLVSLAWAHSYDISQAPETKVWKWDGQNSRWVQEPTGGVGANARAWHQGDRPWGECNKPIWDIEVNNHASVAQWIHWSLSARGWQFRIRKPGIYVADCITFSINSNADVNMKFTGFGDLEKQDNPGQGELIETWYAFNNDSDTPPTSGWYKAGELNSLPTITLLVNNLPIGGGYHLWIKINVRDRDGDNYPKTKACEYQNDGHILLAVTVLKNWIDSEGNFIVPQPAIPGTVVPTFPSSSD